MSEYSKQQIALVTAAIMGVINPVVVLFHLQADTEAITQLVTGLLTLALVIYALWRRYQQGDITLMGSVRNINAKTLTAVDKHEVL